MTGTGDLRRLIRECDALHRCPDCGTHVAHAGAHSCPPGTDGSDGRDEAPSTRGERQPDRSADDAVGVFRRTIGNTYAYHELDDGEVRCWCDRTTKAGRFDVLSRAEAEELGRTPCGSCERLRGFDAE